MNKKSKGSNAGSAYVPPTGTRMPAEAADAVGRRLKAGYSELLREPVPDKFMKLLEQLDASAGSADGADASNSEPACGIDRAEDEKSADKKDVN